MRLVKNILKLLDAYEKYIMAGVAFQSLCNEDDFKNYLYTKQDYKENKPVNNLFLAAINTPELFRKETEKFIKEVIRASELKQNDPDLLSKFRDFKNSWIGLLTEIKNIPSGTKHELITALKNLGTEDAEYYAMAEDLELMEWVDANGNSITSNSIMSTPIKNTTIDFTEKFKKLYGHIDSIWGGLNIIRCAAHTLAIYYGYGQKWYHLIIRYIPTEGCFEINLTERQPSGKLIFAGEADSWTELLDILMQTETIKNRKLCEWVDAKGNKATINTSTSAFNIPAKLPETGYKEKFQKLLDYHKQHIGKDVISTEIKKISNYGFEYQEVTLVPGSTSESILIIEVDMHDDGEYYAYVWQDGKCIDLNHGNDFDILLKLLGKYLNIPDKNSNEYQELVEWVDSNGNKVGIKLPTTVVNSSNSASDDFSAQYRKLRLHIDDIWGDIHTIMCTKHELDIYYGDGTNRQNLNIKFVPAKNYFEIELINSYNYSQIFKGKRSDWGSVLSGLKILGVIKDKSLCEWVTGKSKEVVYIWDIYQDPKDKGVWRSADKYNGEYDGYVYETAEGAKRGGINHLNELEDELYLEGRPSDYTVDITAIPKAEVSDYTLEFSGLK